MKLITHSSPKKRTIIYLQPAGKTSSGAPLRGQTSCSLPPPPPPPARSSTFLLLKTSQQPTVSLTFQIGPSTVGMWGEERPLSKMRTAKKGNFYTFWAKLAEGISILHFFDGIYLILLIPNVKTIPCFSWYLHSIIRSNFKMGILFSAWF